MLREHFDTEPFDGAARRRGACAAASRPPPPRCPSLAEHARRAGAGVRPHRRRRREQAQRVHGDLHLGQTLRTSKGWKLVDFEGEPAKPLSERAAARLALARRRRHAALLRLRRPVGRQGPLRHRRARARRSPTGRNEWVAAQPRARSSTATSRAASEAGGGPTDADEQALIDAYEADKAVYEVLYEARNRPTWLDIPLGAIERIGACTDMNEPTIGEIDLHLINEGRHEQLWQALGAHADADGTDASGSGRRTPRRSRSAATSTAGTAAATRWPQVGDLRRLGGLRPGRRGPATATSSTSAAPTASGATRPTRWPTSPRSRRPPRPGSSRARTSGPTTSG